MNKENVTHTQTHTHNGMVVRSLKKKAILPFETIWMDLEGTIMLNQKMSNLEK